MNQAFDLQKFSLAPVASPSVLDATLAKLLVPGSVMDEYLAACCRRLQSRFELLCSTCPAPQWDRGLLLTPETRLQTELYLPLAEIQSAFRYLLRRSFNYPAFLPAALIFSALSWLDALERMQHGSLKLNPAESIAGIAADYKLRTSFLAALFVPQRYGGGFKRYPLQKTFLLGWLGRQGKKTLSLLDAACGSGEGVYELAELALAAGVAPDLVTVHGCTVEPLELAAAAHGWFPGDPDRESVHREMITLILTGGVSIKFFSEDICQRSGKTGSYDVVICNGLLGGPLLHDVAQLESALQQLSQKVKKGGMILAADRFHAGWRRIVPLLAIEKLLEKNGFRIISPPEGIGGVKTE